ncbi:MAG TPA: nuclear transport factor 2 family protein [Solirubrobacteraceae bacterium]|nr:nuclear transport factor 2 family protein [Solirubrobacteraceae bacterium]
MTVESPALTGFMERYLAAWNGRESSAMDALVTDDIVWFDPALPHPARGQAEVRAFMEQSWRSFPDLRFSEPDPPFIVQDGDRVAWAWRMRGTFSGAPLDPPGFAPTHRTIDVLGIDQWELRDGRIARYRAYYDMADLARQLGIMPPAGSGAEKAMAALQRVQARFMRR